MKTQGKHKRKPLTKLTYSRPVSTLQEAIDFTGEKKQLLNIAPRSLKTLN